MTSVLEATRVNKVSVVEHLVRIPGTVSQRELDVSLAAAVKKKSAECASVLLDAGADANAKDASERVLKKAAELGAFKIVKLLVENGADVNYQENGRGTALHHAAKRGKDACVEVLIKAKAKLDLRDSAGCTPLIAAAKNCHNTHRVMRLLSEAGCDMDCQDNTGRSALHYCSHMAMGVNIILEGGANPNLQDNEGNSPVHLASTEGFDRVIETLLEYNANPDLPNVFGKTALHYLAMKNHVKGINVIAEAGGDVNIVDNNHNLPLWYAVSHNRPGAVKALLRANSRTDPARDSENIAEGGTPLKTALIKKLFGLAKLLILGGCDLAPLHDWMSIILTERRQREAEREEQKRFGIFPTDQEDEEVDEEEEEALHWFEDWLHQPHSLRQLCRIYVRHLLGLSVHSKISALLLPPALIDYISLKEVEDHHVQGYWEK